MFKEQKCPYSFPDDFELKYLYHFTDIQNIPCIRVRGILPRADLERKGIPYKPGGNELSINLNKVKNIGICFHNSTKWLFPCRYLSQKRGRESCINSRNKFYFSFAVKGITINTPAKKWQIQMNKTINDES